MAASPPLPFKAEYAKSNRSSCKSCGKTITKDSLRIASVTASYRFEGNMPMWYHATCVFQTIGFISSPDDVEGLDSLRWEDQQKIRAYVESACIDGAEQSAKEVTESKQAFEAGGQSAKEGVNGEYAIETAKSSRATCKGCNEKIGKGQVRVSTMVISGNSKFRGKVPIWRHAKCFFQLDLWKYPLMTLPGWEDLSIEDQTAVQALENPEVKHAVSPGETTKQKATKKRAMEQVRPSATDGHKKKGKVEVQQENANSDSAIDSPKGSDNNKKLEIQSKKLWSIKDELKKNVRNDELRLMLKENGQDTKGSEYDLRERCADGMLFGALKPCPSCSGPIEFQGDQYRCCGNLSEWTKCTYTTRSPERLNSMWKIPPDSDNKFLQNWFKCQKVKEEKRLFSARLPRPENKKQPVDIDYGAEESSKIEKPMGANSMLHPRVVSLMKLLFDIETYRAAMMEFEINMSEMPLGKLSKRNIEQAFQVLTEIQNVLSMDDLLTRDRLLLDASYRFFMLVPHVHPHVIRDEISLKSKIDMLEALRDIEVATKLMGSTVEDSDKDSLDINYKKLQCAIIPVPHDSDEFALVKKYLENARASTHQKWSLKLEDVFSVVREGEEDAFLPKKPLKNRMLLWHGSRRTNYVGILSQGLRIAPPEAPQTGYMFGKGVYFADLVSKSAQHCYTTKDNPIGLMLLSEVALGEMYELKHAEYMEKAPPGKHSTKGLGQSKPLEKEFEIWGDQVTVPCGRPVASKISDTSLQYNEYIVYDTAQIKLRFLLKVRFQYKGRR